MVAYIMDGCAHHNSINYELVERFIFLSALSSGKHISAPISDYGVMHKRLSHLSTGAYRFVVSYSKPDELLTHGRVHCADHCIQTRGKEGVPHFQACQVIGIKQATALILLKLASQRIPVAVQRGNAFCILGTFKLIGDDNQNWIAEFVRWSLSHCMG
jgi:hypothetical protein